MLEPELGEQNYLGQIELLARDVVQGWPGPFIRSPGHAGAVGLADRRQAPPPPPRTGRPAREG